MRTHRPTSSLRAVLVLVPLIPLTLTFALLTRRWDAGVILAAASFLMYRTFFVQWVVLAAHRRGVREVKQGQHAWALESFRDSEQWFNRYPWMDKHRTWVLLSATKVPFRVLARYNQAYAAAHIGENALARQLLEEVIKEQGDLRQARDLLRNLDPDEE